MSRADALRLGVRGLWFLRHRIIGRYLVNGPLWELQCALMDAELRRRWPVDHAVVAAGIANWCPR